jgi:flagellar assembly factor FliW
MSSPQQDRAKVTSPHRQKNIHFPEGLPAFERVCDFLLIWNEEEAPFVWLQAAKHPDLSFITIDPFLIYPDYLPDIPEEDVQKLHIESEEDVFLLSIVNVRNNPDLQITANLLSPLVINWREQIGKQVILTNHQKYSVKFAIHQNR